MFILTFQVHDIMGLCRSDNKSVEPMSVFSKDVRRLEIWGPDEGYASIIDLPGIFKFTVPGQTALRDIEFVREMVLGYMQNPRSVILTVIPANEDIATQDILQMAREADPDGYRTLGVLTKPDLVDERTEAGSMDLVEGKNLDLSFRWAIVRNPEQKQLPAQSTGRDDIKDNFFRNTAPWNRLDKKNVGILGLKARLMKARTNHVCRMFPQVTSFLEPWACIPILTK